MRDRDFSPRDLFQGEVVRRTLHSIIIVAVGVMVFLAYRAGYLRRRPGQKPVGEIRDYTH